MTVCDFHYPGIFDIFFITLDTLASVICFWLRLQPSLLVFAELNINMFTKRNEFPYTSAMFKISFLNNSCSFFSMYSLNLVKLWADLFQTHILQKPFYFSTVFLL